jgi:hypothetical protein
VKYLSPYRIATYLLVLFFVGHTGGGMLSQKSLGPPSDAVFASMKAVHFTFNGADCTWYGFWFGFGLVVSVFLLLSAIVAWQLDKVAPAQWSAVSVIAWAFCAAHLVNAALSWKYFFAGPGTIGTAVALLLGIGAWRKQARAADRSVGAT